ncbi:ADP-ribosylhydrolase ARH3 [Halyomorpha halys]|uniref:ADP-ribosylhydrolase ARH3 n=1 Tax=Halyomorpha halys TaxID=286706 RepID=UPI0006D5186F|nr:poly(ADP-ribose) glycohydrolase ARH3-like [Halyomorpha halys]
MSVAALETAVIASKFRGALVGALIGDCFGAPFDHDGKVSKVILQKYFDKMEDPSFKSPAKSYTDDTAMTKALTESLVTHHSLNELDLAKRLVGNYFSIKEPDRSYGSQTTTIFHKLKNSKFDDIWLPAKELFNGEGSLGSGGATRITPIAIFCYSNYDLMLNFAEKCTKLTHTHKLGVNGALLQAIAVNQSFYSLPNVPLNVDKFVTDLINKMADLEKIESDNVYLKEEEPTPYKNRLEEIQRLLKRNEVDDDEVIAKLGNSEEALNSVPTALYCFLRSEKPIKTVKTENKFRRAVQYSISLGGNTDTIASMAGAISGAYHGYEYINKSIQSHCEKIKETINLADQLYGIIK